MQGFKSAQDLDKITTISFDGDGTLWDFRSSMESALTLTLQQLRLIVANEASKHLTVQKMIEIRDSVARKLGEGVVGHEQIRYTAFLRTLEYVGAPSQPVAKQLYQLYMDARFTGTRPYPDVPVGLRDLRNRYRIGMISNGNSYPERCGLPNTFDFTVFAAECGFRKPDSRIFEFALSRIDCEPQEVLHVGDSLKDDVFGANNSGLRSVWLNREHLSNETDIIPDLEIRDIHGLTAFLQ